MKVGIIGRMSAGRSTLFRAVTGQDPGAQASSKVRLGIARMLDPRVDRLAAICKPRKIVPAEFVLALIPPAPTGPADITRLREMRELKAYVHVVGTFSGEPVERTAAAAIAELSTELVLGDMERVERRIANIGKGGGARPREEELLKRAAACLEVERPLRMEQWDEQLVGLLDELGLVSHRPLLTVVNVSEEQVNVEPPAAVVQGAEAVGGSVMWLSALLEAEIAGLEGEDQREFLSAYGLSEPLSQRFLAQAFQMLNQICFFTIGPDEVRAWPIPRHSSARRAARAIHSDLEKGFIRAEVVDYDTLVEVGSEAKCKATGVMRTEGKDYQVQDGDIINVRFNI